MFVRAGVRKHCVGQIQPTTSFDIYWSAATPILLLWVIKAELRSGDREHTALKVSNTYYLALHRKKRC